MLDTLEDLLPKVLDDIEENLGLAKLSWDSLVINRRKPYTYRIFKQFGDLRVCLHKFEPCESDEAFAHPHPWPGAFLVLDGSYEQTIGYSKYFNTLPEEVMKMRAVRGTRYEIVNPLTWHSIRPLTTTHTIMVNGATFSRQHEQVVTTKGKDLEKMSNDDLYIALNNFHRLLYNFV